MIDLSFGHVRILNPADRDFPDVGAEYTPPQGYDALRVAAASWVGVAVDTVAITTGASVALAAALATLEKPGSALCPRPYYPIYPRLAELFGLELIYYDLRPDLDWQPDSDQLRRLIRGNTRAILLNWPGNPIGMLPGAELLAALRELTASRDLLVISDEVYADYLYDGATVPDLSGITDPHSVVRIRSFSKLLGMPGERVGFVIADHDRLTAISRAHWTLALSPPATAQAIALSRMRGAVRDYVRRQCVVLERNRDRMAAILSRSGTVRVVKPMGGIFLWLGPFDRLVDPASLGKACLDQAGVAVMPGTAFGIAEPAYLRVSFAVPEHEATRGAQALADFFGRL